MHAARDKFGFRVAIQGVGQLRFDGGIAYAPDDQANADGIIMVAAAYFSISDQRQVLADIEKIYDCTAQIMRRSYESTRPKSDAAPILQL
ncbi:MAG: hypothetical protein AAF870_08980 [Pseudomonadota bacterium]